jgi:hypothetical protein
MRLALLTLVLVYGARAQQYANNLPLEHYRDCTPDDAVARLQTQLDRNSAALDFAGESLGYLPAVLRLLGIHADSQALVFSKTSFQAAKISPRNPRAIYFNDEVAVGFLPGQGMELAALDSRQGIIFYTLSGIKSEKPRFIRSQTCLRCHQGPATAGVPGIFVGSVYPGPTGLPNREDAIVTDHTSAFEDRWGGWYVNAKSGQPHDRSNAVAPDPAEPHELMKLDRFFNPAPYLSPTSDIVALMTFEHQTQMVNLLTRVGWEVRMGLAPDLDQVFSYMTFAGEAKLKEPIEGVSSFTKTFPEAGPRDRKGRSLRDFDLQTRLFKYPLSYLIYSAQFDALPAPTRSEIYSRIKSKPIVEILCDTKQDLPASMCR